MSQNDKILREEFQAQVTDAYDGVSLDAETKAEYKQKIFAKSKRVDARNRYFKVAAVIAGFVLFVGLNAILVLMNQRKNEVAIDPTKGTEEFVTTKAAKKEFSEGEVIYTTQIYTNYPQGSYYNYDVEVLFVDDENARVEGTLRQGNFVIRTRNSKGELIDEETLVSGAVGENGLSIRTDSVEDYFGKSSGANSLIFTYPIKEGDEHKLYLTKFFGVDYAGMVEALSHDNEIPVQLQTGNTQDIFTSNNLRTMPNQMGLYYDYVISEENPDEAVLVIYEANPTEGTLKVYQSYEGYVAGDDIDAAVKGTKIKYEMLTGHSVPYESEEYIAGIEGSADSSQGYKQVSTEIATDRESLVEYICDAFTKPEVIGFDTKSELDEFLFGEIIYSGNPNLNEPALFKMIDGKLGSRHTIGLAVSCGDQIVAVPIDKFTSDVYIMSHTLDSRLVVRVQVSLGTDNKWRVSQIEKIEFWSELDKWQNSSDSKLDVYKMVAEAWAKNYCKKDGEAIVGIASYDLRTCLEKENVLWMQDDVYYMGSGGYWPSEYEIVQCDDMSATIRYYADYHFWDATQKAVWVEYITFAEDNLMTKVVDETMVRLYKISTAEEFLLAYPDCKINDTPMDYVTNGMGELLNQYSIENPNDQIFKLYLNPKSAAISFLNLSDDESKVLVETEVLYQHNTDVRATITFVESGESFDVIMTQPFGNNGIYVPQDCDVNEVIMGVSLADVNHDGILDAIVTSIPYDETVPEDIDRAYIGYVRVYQNIGNAVPDSYEGYDCLYEKMFSYSRTANMQLSLVEDDGRWYLLESFLNEQQGEGEYYYKVFWLNADGEQVIVEDSICFKTEGAGEVSWKLPEREQVVPEFMEKMKLWYEGGRLIIAADVSIEKYYYSTTAQNVAPSEYYDKIWSRMAQ